MTEANKQVVQVTDYAQALQSVQGLESRGDFQFRGVHKFFMTIHEWTEKYSTNKTLPTVEQLMKNVGLEKEQVDLFVNEICIKRNPPLIKKISTIEYVPNSSAKSEILSNLLKPITVFARPTVIDAGSAHRYVLGCNESSAEAIKNCIKNNRVPYKGDKFRDLIFSKINSNKLSDTYASADIGNLFTCPYNTTKDLKQETINMHLKPVLKKLIEDKTLLFFRNENASKSGNKSIFLYNNKEEIVERVDIYLQYLKKNIVPLLQRIGVISQISEEEYAEFNTLAETLLTYMDESYADQRTMVGELIVLYKFYEQFTEDSVKKNVREKLNEVLSLLENAGKMVDISAIRINGEPLPQEIVPLLISNENILHAEYDDNRNYYEFILHKKCVKQAIAQAKKVYNSTGVDTDVRILNKMNVMKLLDKDEQKEFIGVESESLFKYLPFLVRMWRRLFGNIFVTKEEAQAIRVQLEMEQKKRIIESKQKVIEKEKSKLAEERIKRKETTEKVEKEEAISMSSESGEGINFDDEKEVRNVQQKIATILDYAWDSKILPDREYLLENLGNLMTENQLIFFLKKFSQKDILSFQIKSKSNNVTKYKWPILVSRSYLKRNGQKLLDNAKKQTDEQRKSLMPDQDKFDVYNSIEDFLNKIIYKI
ncbi:MAG: hypothetical protein H7A23_19770 [Leptospiraceae bacterium]|nr:hypothetical protein [Leptospiraceae bacterium]MCP5496795.1 hypothetical protein [Leptospiraceae bacterium]